MHYIHNTCLFHALIIICKAFLQKNLKPELVPEQGLWLILIFKIDLSMINLERLFIVYLEMGKWKSFMSSLMVIMQV